MAGHLSRRCPSVRSRSSEALNAECDGFISIRKLDSLFWHFYYEHMSVGVETGRKNWTEADLQSLPEEGYIHEVVNGKLVMSPKNDFFHGEICSELLTALRAFVRDKRLGAVLDSSTGFWMKTETAVRLTFPLSVANDSCHLGLRGRRVHSFQGRRILLWRFFPQTARVPKLTNV